ncbi:hypothetical protein CSPX01_05029 [Colletotrichum filicis]|nr:hypothetical protein CSPX01_05029 [Colletotrichum filicis]
MVPFDVEDDFECAGSILLLRGRPGQAEGVKVLIDDDRSGQSVGARCLGLQTWDDAVVLAHIQRQIIEERSRPGSSGAWEKLACGQQIVIQ